MSAILTRGMKGGFGVDGYTNELLSGGTTNYFESGTTNSCIFPKVEQRIHGCSIGE